MPIRMVDPQHRAFSEMDGWTLAAAATLCQLKSQVLKTDMPQSRACQLSTSGSTAQFPANSRVTSRHCPCAAVHVRPWRLHPR